MSSAEAASQKTMIVLRSSDGEIFEVEEAVAAQSQAIKQMMEDDCANATIPLPNVTSEILTKVLEYCKRHVDAAAKASRDSTSSCSLAEVELKEFDAEFMKVDQRTLFDLILAANYLNIASLFELTTRTVADMMRGKSPEELRKIFHIENDYTKEEEEEVRRENTWAFED